MILSRLVMSVYEDRSSPPTAKPVVKPQQVVLGQPRRLMGVLIVSCDAAWPILAMKPVRQPGGALKRSDVGSGVSLFAQARLYEALSHCPESF